jgi:PAS domain S-box-containing protein
VAFLRRNRKIQKIEEELFILTQEYEKVFNSTQDALFLINVINKNIFRYIRNNKSHEKLTGLKLDELRGKTPQELLGEEFGTELAKNYSMCLKSKEPYGYEETLDLPTGKRTWYTTLTPVFNENGEIYIVGSAQDITKRKELQEALYHEKKHLEIILHSIGEGVISTNHEGIITTINRAAEKICAIKKKRL